MTSLIAFACFFEGLLLSSFSFSYQAFSIKACTESKSAAFQLVLRSFHTGLFNPKFLDFVCLLWTEDFSFFNGSVETLISSLYFSSTTYIDLGATAAVDFLDEISYGLESFLISLALVDTIDGVYDAYDGKAENDEIICG